MTNGHRAELTTGKGRTYAATWRGVLSWLFARESVIETVATQVHLDVSPEVAWNLIMFYEEVSGRPPFLLRMFMPTPLRTEGKKTGVGARVRCIYKGGDLVKRITAIEAPRLVQFEVMDQRLGIEACAVALEGSYVIRRRENGADIVLTTRYAAYLHPRLLWSPLERLVTGQLHRHILKGMRRRLSDLPCVVSSPPACLSSLSPKEGGLACTASPSPSHR